MFVGNFYLQDTKEGNSQDKPLYRQRQQQQQRRQQYIDSYLLSQVKGVKHQEEEEEEVTLKSYNKNNKQKFIDLLGLPPLIKLETRERNNKNFYNMKTTDGTQHWPKYICQIHFGSVAGYHTAIAIETQDHGINYPKKDVLVIVKCMYGHVMIMP